MENVEEKAYQRKMRGVSKALSIISKIAKVFIIIGGVCVLLALIVIPLIFKNITFEGDQIKIGNESVLTLKMEEDKMVLKIGDNVVAADATLDDYKEIVKLFNSESKTSIISYIEGSLFIAVVALVLLYLVFNYIDKIFNNIHKEKTPFILDNVMYIRKCAYLYIAFVVAPLVLSGIFEMITGNNMSFNLNLLEVIFVLVLFTISYVFEYGYELENKDNKKVKTVKE